MAMNLLKTKQNIFLQLQQKEKDQTRKHECNSSLWSIFNL